MPRAAQQLSLKGRALKYLSAREHSRAELARKLAPHAEDPETIEPLLDELQARGFLSDARFVESVLHRRAGRLGAARVKQELQLKGIAADQIRAAVQSLQATELERAHAVWRQRFGEPAADAREYTRQARFLMARGFASEVVRRVLKGGDLDLGD
jgi:regulatory protein